jgi:tRNA(Ile)-lysidine synthetase-like protein
VEAILRICSSTQGHDRVVVPGVDALRSFDTLLLTRPGELASRPRQYRLELKFGEKCRLPYDAGWIDLNRVKPGSQNCANFKEEKQFPAEVEHLDSEALTDQNARLYVRNWEPGDSLQRSGHKTAEKIKSLFQEHRVLLWERRHWPVIVAGDEIVWVRRFGVAAKFDASNTSRGSIRLIYVPGE